jgi:hypothetical protein
LGDAGKRASVAHLGRSRNRGKDLRTQFGGGDDDELARLCVKGKPGGGCLMVDDDESGPELRDELIAVGMLEGIYDKRLVWNLVGSRPLAGVKRSATTGSEMASSRSTREDRINLPATATRVAPFDPSGVAEISQRAETPNALRDSGLIADIPTG